MARRKALAQVDAPEDPQGTDAPSLETNQKQLRKEKNLEEAGVTRKKLYETLARGLTAKRVVTEIHNGKMVVNEFDDMLIQHKYMETGLKMYGDLVDEKVGLNVLNLDAQLSQTILKETRKAIASMEGGGRMEGGDNGVPSVG